MPANNEKHVRPSFSAPSSSIPLSSIDDTDDIKVNDGGLIAWLHCLSAFLLFFTGWGIVNSFGERSSSLRVFLQWLNKRIRCISDFLRGSNSLS